MRQRKKVRKKISSLPCTSYFESNSRILSSSANFSLSFFVLPFGRFIFPHFKKIHRFTDSERIGETKSTIHTEEIKK